jgi:hypothetical protein
MSIERGPSRHHRIADREDKPSGFCLEESSVHAISLTPSKVRGGSTQGKGKMETSADIAIHSTLGLPDTMVL